MPRYSVRRRQGLWVILRGKALTRVKLMWLSGFTLKADAETVAYWLNRR